MRRLVCILFMTLRKRCICTSLMILCWYRSYTIILGTQYYPNLASGLTSSTILTVVYLSDKLMDAGKPPKTANVLMVTCVKSYPVRFLSIRPLSINPSVRLFFSLCPTLSVSFFSVPFDLCLSHPASNPNCLKFSLGWMSWLFSSLCWLLLLFDPHCLYFRVQTVCFV